MKFDTIHFFLSEFLLDPDLVLDIVTAVNILYTEY